MTVNIVTALPVEAAPMIRGFELQRCQHDAQVPVYENHDKAIRLLVCGVGAERATNAIAVIGSERQTDQSLQGWLNIGIAGHSREQVGTCLLANRISDRESGNSVYPHIDKQDSKLKSCHLITVPAPETEYSEEGAFDMEAYGFFNAAMACSVVELIAVLKIVSDNPQQGTEHIDPEMVESLIEAKLPVISQCLAQLQNRVREYNAIYSIPAQFAELQHRVRLTFGQRSQLLDHCRRLLASGRAAELDALCARSHHDGRSLLDAVRAISRS